MQNGPRFLTQADIEVLTLLNPSNVPANQPSAMHDELGSVGVTEDGRTFRMVKFAGTSTINPGVLLVAPAAPSNSTGLAIPTTQPSTTSTGNGASGTSALAAGTLSFNVTNGTTSVTQDEFQFVEIIVSAGGSYNLRLRGHTLAGNGGTITLYLADPLPATATTLIAGTDTVNLRYSNWNQPIASATQAAPVGVTVVPVPQSSTASYAGWVQTGGRAFVYAPNSGTKGYPATQDLSTAGGIAVPGAGASETSTLLGSYVASAASSLATVNLAIPV